MRADIFRFGFTQLLREVETQAIASQQQIALTRTQQAAKQREMRMAQLTRTEILSLPADTNVYEGVGKMYVFPKLVLCYVVTSSQSP